MSRDDVSAAALRRAVACGDGDACADLLRRDGGALLAAGQVAPVLDAARLVPTAQRDPTIDLVVGEALGAGGDWDGALAAFRRAAGTADALPPALAWRMGRLHHLRGDLDEAVSLYERADGSGDICDRALNDSWLAGAHWLRGDAERCAAHAERGLALAEACGEDRALAAAHTAMALRAALEGDRAGNAAHYERALRAARRAGDHLQTVRIRVNLASRLIEEGSCQDALAELDAAVEQAETAGYAPLYGLCLLNRAEAQRRLGLLDESQLGYETARDVFQRLDSRMLAYALCGLGDVRRIRGHDASARAAYAEAIAIAERSGDKQALAPALCGLALVTARSDVGAAAHLADRACEIGGMAQVAALLARGWIALQAGEEDRAAGLADTACAVAGRRRDRAGLAEALALAALAGDDDEAPPRLREAAALWTEVGDPIGEAVVAWLRTRIAAAPDDADVAERRVRALGVALTAVPLGVEDRAPAPIVEIRTLGGFAVRRRGRPVEATAWPSKKARDLAKLLVARRGRPVPRDELIGVLWPGEDPARVGNRLSVALSTLRGVLDPAHDLPGDRIVGADRQALWLRLDHVHVDVEEFLRLAAVGSRDAVDRLARAEAAYTGDFLPEDVYEDWSVPLREEARAAYLTVTHRLSAAAAQRGDLPAAVRYCLRLLEHDPYDERAHLRLVTALQDAGRHGEARRLYRRYAAAMRHLDVEPAPCPVPARPEGDRKAG